MNNYNDNNGGNRGYGNQYPQNNGQGQYPSSGNNMQYNYQMNQPYANNMGYPEQQYYPPQDPYQQNYAYEEEDDYDNLEEIERELNKGGSADYEREMMEAEGLSMNSPGGYGHRGHQKQYENHGHGRPANTSGAFVPQAAVPSQNGKLSQFAGEFWFPECRNCPCCKGFKHGCNCCKSGGVTTCKDPACIDGAFETQVTADLASRPAATTSSEPTTSTDSASAPKHAPYVVSAPASADNNNSSSNFCTFEKSPGGCRFGAGCRFKHMSANGGAAPSQRCTFFARGNCQFGDACRFGHF